VKYQYKSIFLAVLIVSWAGVILGSCRSVTPLIVEKTKEGTKIYPYKGWDEKKKQIKAKSYFQIYDKNGQSIKKGELMTPPFVFPKPVFMVDYGVTLNSNFGSKIVSNVPVTVKQKIVDENGNVSYQEVSDQPIQNFAIIPLIPLTKDIVDQLQKSKIGLQNLTFWISNSFQLMQEIKDQTEKVDVSPWQDKTMLTADSKIFNKPYAFIGRKTAGILTNDPSRNNYKSLSISFDPNDKSKPTLRFKLNAATGLYKLDYNPMAANPLSNGTVQYGPLEYQIRFHKRECNASPVVPYLLIGYRETVEIESATQELGQDGSGRGHVVSQK
jgi:hypothetical protein